MLTKELFMKNTSGGLVRGSSVSRVMHLFFVWLLENAQPWKMKGQSEIAYLPNFADLYVKLKLEFLIASPICYILSCWSLL